MSCAPFGVVFGLILSLYLVQLAVNLGNVSEETPVWIAR